MDQSSCSCSVSYEFPQASSLIVLMKLVLCTRSALDHQRLPASTAPWGPVLCPCFLVQGQNAEHALVFVGLSYMAYKVQR